MEFRIGTGLAIIFGLLAFVVREMPSWITWPGLAFGVLFAIWGIVPQHKKISDTLVVIILVGFCGIFGATIWHYHWGISGDIGVGAIAKINALPPNRLKDGTYTFRATVENAGTSAMINFGTQFAIAYPTATLTEAQENEVYYNEARLFIEEYKGLNLHSGIGNSLGTDDGIGFLMPDGHLTQDQFNDILSGAKKAYVFATVIYFDATTPSDTYYLGQSCSIYQPSANAYSPCLHGSFDKLVEHMAN